MTSTNDGRDVKSNQTSGPKGKTYYIELYKSLESRLSGECPLRERTGHLGEAWRRVHSLCQHSAPSTHPHLLSWLQRHTAKTVLQTEWQSPTSKDEHTTLEEAIDAFINESQTAITARNGLSPAWESQLMQRAAWFKKILSNPWGHPVLRVLLDPRGKPPSDDEILEWLKEERGVMFVTRLRQLAASKCDDLAMLLTAAVMGRVRAHTPLLNDAEQCDDTKDKPPPESSESTFTEILKSEAGFTVDVWELLTDIEFVLLYKRDRHSSCIDLAKQTPLRNGYQLVERLQSRLETSPREKKLWKNAKEVAALITQVIIARCMVVPVCASVSRSALYCCTRSLVRLVARGALPAAAAALAAPAATARHLHTLAAAVDAQSTEDMKPFVCELYVRAITAGMNELERLKITAQKESEARLAEQTLSAWFTQLGGLLAGSDRIKCECTLTAFSVHPSPVMYERIKTAPLLPPVAIDAQEPKDEATNSEYGSWASDSRSQTNFVKTSETLKLKHTQFQANVLSTALLTEGERLGLGAEVCQDIAVLLSGPRVKTLSWDMDRELLLENCRTYMERTHGGTRALTTELKYLNLDPKNFQHLPEEDDDDTDIYYGIEKGYEHLVEFQEPEEIWQDAVIDPERTETASSFESDNCSKSPVRRKKKGKKKVASSEEESDPLSIVAEAKRVEGMKERPHSKERSKEHRRNKSQEKMDKPKKEHSRERRKETHKKDKKKEKKERKNRKKNDNNEESKPTVESLKIPNIGSLSSLIGMKIANMRKNLPNDATKAALSITDSDYDSQGKISLTSLNSEGNESNVLFDGLYSMDELKSPEKSSHATQTNNDRSPVSAKRDEAGNKPRYNMDLLNDSLSRVPTIPDCLSYVPNTTLSEEVKLSITKLLNFRRQRQVESALKESTSAVTSPSPTQMPQHNWKTMAKHTFKSPKAIIKPEMMLPSQISPKVVTIPEIPKMYIDKKQLNQLNNELKHEVNDLSLATNKGSKNIRSPVASGSTNISITNNTMQPTAMSNPDKIKDTNMHPNTSIIPKQENAFTEVGKKGDQSTPSMVPNAAEMLAKFDTPSQKRFQDFLKELQESINAGTGEEKSKIFLTPQPTSRKKEMKPMSRVTPVIVNARAETKSSPQSAKQLVQQKKVENSLNTFSRLSYMHKNKLTDSKIKQDTNTDHQDPLQQRIGGAEMDRILADHKNTKMKHLQYKSDLVISRIYTPKPTDKSQISIKKGRPQESPVCKEHPVLSNMLQNQMKQVQMESPNFSPPSVPLRTSSLLEKDQEDLKFLLQQQGKLNSLRVPPRNDIANTSVHNVQLLQSSTNHKMTSMNHTTPYTKIPPSNTKIATPQIKNQVPNQAVQMTTVTNSLISTNVLKNVDVKATQHQPLNMTKPLNYYNDALVPKDYSIQPQDKVINNACEDKPITNEDKQTDWKSVMDAIRASKTPIRSPNELDMAAKKDSTKRSDTDLRNQRIVRTKSTTELNLKDKTKSDVKCNDEYTFVSNRNIQNNVTHRDKGLIISKTKSAHDTCRNLNVSNDMKHHDKGLPKSKTKSSHDTFRSNLDVSNDIKHHDMVLLKSKTKSVLDTSCYNLNVSNEKQSSDKHRDKSSKSKMKSSFDTSSSYQNVPDDLKHHDKSLAKSKMKLAHDTPRSNLDIPSISQREADNVIITYKAKSREKSRVTKQLNTHAVPCPPNIVKAENLEASKKISKTSSQLDGTAKLSSNTPNNQYTPDNRKRQFTCSLPKEDDPFISGIQNSDYDLLEELMDDDLRQEIGELSSDEETFRSSLESQKGVKTSVIGKSGSNVVNKSYHTVLIEDKIRALETMHVPNAQQKSLVTIQKSAIQTPTTNRHSKNIVTEATLDKQTTSKLESRPKDVTNPDPLLNKPCIRPPNVIRNLPSNIVLTPKNDTKQNSHATNSLVADPTKVFVTAVPQQTNLHNVVIIGSELIYDTSSIKDPVKASVNSMAQNTYLTYSNAPSMTLFQTTRFAAPSVNPLIIGNALTVPIVPNIATTIASPIIDNTVQTVQIHVAANNIKVHDNLQSEINIINVKEPLKPTIDQYLDDSYTKMENKVQLDVNSNKDSERKVLSQVQEKLNRTEEKNDTKYHRLSIEIDVKKEILKDQERLKKKRMAIMNREICHRCDNKPIPLAYEPLKPQAPCVLDQSVSKQNNNTATQDINKIDLKLDITQSHADIPNKEIIISANLDGIENCKENKSTSISCRRIMLRSSNKLKPKVNSPPEVSKNHVTRKTKVRLKKESPQKFDILVETEGKSSEVESAVNSEKLDLPVETGCDVASVITPIRTSKRTLISRKKEINKKLPKVKDFAKRVAKTRCKRNKVIVKKKRQSKLQNGCKIPKIESSDVKLIDIEDELVGSKILKITSQTILTDKIIDAKRCETKSPTRDEQEFKDFKISSQKIFTMNGTGPKATETISDINNHQPKKLNDEKQVLHTNSHQMIPVTPVKPDDAMPKAHKTVPIKQATANNTKPPIAEDNGDIIAPTRGEKTTQYKEITVIKNDQNKPEIEIAVDVKSSKKIEMGQPLKHTGSDYSSNNSNIAHNDSNILNSRDKNTVIINDVAKDRMSTSDKIIDTLSVTDRIINSNENKKKEKLMGPRKVLNPTLYKSQQTLLIPANSSAEISDKKSTKNTMEDVNGSNNRENMKNIPQSFKDSIIIESLPSHVTNDPIKKCVRIKLPSGRAFKATVHGSMPVDFDSLFADPTIKSILLNTINYKNKYTLNIKQVTTSDKQNPHKILETRFQDFNVRTKFPSDEIETVNLLSDDEDEDVYQNFKTEFGDYKVLAMDRDIFAQHQNKLSKKCSVKIIREILTQSNASKEKDISSTDNTEDSKFSSIHKCNDESSLTANFGTENNNDLFAGKTDKRVNNTENTITEKTCKDIISNSLNNENDIQINDIIEIDDTSNDSVDLTSYVYQPLEDFPKDSAPECEETINQLKGLLLKELGVDEASKETLNIANTVSMDNNKTAEKQLPSNPVDVSKCVVKITKCDDLVKKYDEIMKRKCFIELVRCDDLIQNTSLSSMKQTEADEEILYAADSNTLDTLELHAQENIEIGVEYMITSPNTTILSRSGSYSILDDFSLFDDVDANIESENECDRSSPVMEVFELIAALDNKSIKASKIRENNKKLTTSIEHISCDSEWFISKYSLSQNHKTIINERINSRRKIISNEDNLHEEDLDCITIINNQNISCASEWLLSKCSISKNYKTINKEIYTTNIIRTDKNNKIYKDVSNITVSNMMENNLRLSTNPELNMSCDSEWLVSKRSVSQNHKTIINAVTLTHNKMMIDEDNLLSNDVSNLTWSTNIKEQDLRLSTSPKFDISCEAEWLISKRKISQYHKIITNGTTLIQNKILLNEDNLLKEVISNDTANKITDQNIKLSSSLEFNISCESEWLLSKRKISQNYKTVKYETIQNKITSDIDNLFSKDTITNYSTYISKDKVIVEELRSLKLCVPTLISTVTNFLHDNPTLVHKLKPSHKRKITNDCSTVARKISKISLNTSKKENMHKISRVKTSSIKSIVTTNYKTDTNEKLEAKEFCLKHDDSIQINLPVACPIITKEYTNCEKEDHSFANLNLNNSTERENNTPELIASKSSNLLTFDKHDSEENINDRIKMLVNGNILDEEATDTSQELNVPDIYVSSTYTGNSKIDSIPISNKITDKRCKDIRSDPMNIVQINDIIEIENSSDYSDDLTSYDNQPIEVLSKGAACQSVSPEIVQDQEDNKNTVMNIINNSHEKTLKRTTLFDHEYFMSCELENQNINNTLSVDSIINAVSNHSSTPDRDGLVKNGVIHEGVHTQRTNATINIQNDLISEFEVVIMDCGDEDKNRKKSDEHLEDKKKGSSKTQEISGCNQSKKCDTTEESECNKIICTEDKIVTKNIGGGASNKEAQLTIDKPGMGVDEIFADDTNNRNLHDHSKTKPEYSKINIDPNVNDDNISEDRDTISFHDDSKTYKDFEEKEKRKISKENIECSVDNFTTNILPSYRTVTEFTHIIQEVSGVYLKSTLLKTDDNFNLHDNPKYTKGQEETVITQYCDPNMRYVDSELDDVKISEQNNKLTEDIIQTTQDKLLLDDNDSTHVALKKILGIQDDGEILSESSQNRKVLEETLKRSCEINKNTDFYVDLKIDERKLDDNEITHEKKILTVDNMDYMNILENTSEDKQVTLIYKDESGIVLKGIEYEDPEMGTCYMFPLIQDKFENGENYDINTVEIDEDISEIDNDNTIQDTVYFKVMVPKVTYSKRSMESSVSIKIGRNSKRNLKRKINMTDVKIAKKRYKKGKNIDNKKSTQAAINDTMYCKEYRRLIEYQSSLKFSYSRPFHKDHIEVHDMLTAWPIKGPCAETQNDIEIDRNLFIDIEHKDKLKVVQDPMQKTLAEELSVEYREPLLSRDINETSFIMGFGEGSGRVIQNLEDGGDISSFSAATLSDVKQTQPFLQSVNYNVCIKEQRIENTKNDQMKAMKRYFNNIYLKDKVRSFFNKNTIELKNDWVKDLGKNDKNRDNTTKFPFGLNLPDFIEPAPSETILQVVQVGQLPVSAAAQNPVTCDPRVTQVSDASPSQCSAENSPHDDSQSPVQNEYTELTTADLRIPMQEYAQHNQIINMESQESINDENIPIETEIKSVVKIELMEEVAEEKDDQNESLEFNEQQPLTNNHIADNIDYSYDTNNTNTSSESDSNMQLIFSSTEKQSIPDTFSHQEQQNDSSEKTDQIAHAMNAAGITTSAESLSNSRAQALVNMLSQKIRQGAVGTNQATANNYTKATSINAMALQQALAQILPPPLNQSNTENHQQTTSNPPQVLHIVQGKTGTGNQITLVDNTQQSVINTANSTSVLHIVQNKGTSSGPTSNGTPAQQSNSFGGLSLVDTGLQQGGNQLLHIVNTGNQKSNPTGQLLKRVNLLTNLTNVQGSNEQKMVQFVCKSADGKAIQLNAPHQRSMVLRLQPIESQNIPTTPKSVDSQDLSPSSNSTPSKEALASQQEIKSRSVYEENYAKFIQNSSTKSSVPEKSTSLPKFNQAFGKQVFQDGNQKQNEMNNRNSHLPSVNTNPEQTECQSTDNNISLDHISQISSPPLILRKSPAQSSSQSQQNLVQQIKQTIAPMNIQTMHGGVIYTRQIPVNIGGGQTINLITVPSSELIDESTQKQQSDVKFVSQNEIEPSIIKIVPQSQPAPNAEVSAEEHNSQVTNDNAHTPQPQPVLTQMRIKLPMLSKNPQMVSGARVVRPSFFQIQRNVIGGANQPVYQQLVLTAAPPLGQQTIRLPQTQTSRQIKVPSESQSSNESQMSSSTLEQLREFDLVLEQVKERSTVQPNATSNSAFSKLHTSSTDATDGATSVISTPTETTQQVLYSIGNNQPLNVTYVNRKATVSTPTTSTFVRSPDSSGIADSPSSSTHVQIPHTVTTESSSDATSHTKAAKVGSKSKSRPKASSNPPNTMKINTIPPKPSTQKPLEDEQTTQRILYILAEYKEQVENSPDKDKPAPRRRANAPSNPGSSKRKKSSSGSRRPGARDMSPIHGEDTCRTMGSEDSSCGTSQGDCNESCIDSHSPQDSPQKVVRRLTFEQETPIVQPRPLPQRNVIVADGQTITVARGTAGKPTTAVLMPANYILPVSMVKGGQQIAIVTNRGPKLLTVGGEGGTTNALLLQRLIGPAGLKPVLTRPGVRHVRLPTAALHNLQAFNLATPTTVQPPDSTASHTSAPAPPDLIDTRASASPWADRDDMKPDRGSSPEDSEPWNLASSADPHDYTYEETVRTDNMNRTVLDPIQDRYSPDMEAQRIFDKMFDVESKKSYMVNSPRCGYDIDASDCDDKAYHQVVHKKDGHRQHRLTHVSAAALRHKYAILEHELRLQKSLSEECEDLGVDSPSAAELFPEAELLFATSPAHDHTQEQAHHSHTPQPILMSGSGIPQPDMEDQIATDQLLTRDRTPDERQDLGLGLEDVGIVTVSEDGMQATIALDQEEFARSHPNTTFHSEPDVGVVQPFTIAGLKTRHITSIFHANRAPGTVLMTAPQTTVISQATSEPHIQNAVKYSDIDNMINSLPAHSNNINLSSVLVKDDGLTRFDSILTDSRELHLSNTASAIIHSSGNATQVIRRVCYDDDKRERDTRFLMDEPEGLIAGNDAKMIAEDSSRDATLGSMTGDVDDDRSSPERHAELFWESNSASERSDGRRPLDFSSDSDKCCKSPSFDETNSTDSSGVGTHMRLDSVIKEARGIDRSASAGSSADDTHPPLRTYPPKRLYQPLEVEMERSVSGKTRAGERSPDVRRRASGRGVVKRGCHCCNGSPAPPRPKKSRQKKPTMDFTANN